MKYFLWVTLALLCTAIGVLLWNPRLHTSPVDVQAPLAVGSPGGDFTLHSEGKVFDLKAYRGLVVVLYFGYTFCPDICPTALGSMALAFRELPSKDLDRVQGVFISVDPARDTIAQLEKYTTFFHPKIMGFTGSHAELKKVARQYSVFYQIQPPKNPGGTDYSVDHSGSLYIINPEGKLVQVLQHEDTPETIQKAIIQALTTSVTPSQ